MDVAGDVCCCFNNMRPITLLAWLTVSSRHFHHRCSEEGRVFSAAVGTNVTRRNTAIEINTVKRIIYFSVLRFLLTPKMEFSEYTPQAHYYRLYSAHVVHVCTCRSCIRTYVLIREVHVLARWLCSQYHRVLTTQNRAMTSQRRKATQWPWYVRSAVDLSPLSHGIDVLLTRQCPKVRTANLQAPRPEVLTVMFSVCFSACITVYIPLSDFFT